MTNFNKGNWFINKEETHIAEVEDVVDENTSVVTWYSLDDRGSVVHQTCNNTVLNRDATAGEIGLGSNIKKFVDAGREYGQFKEGDELYLTNVGRFTIKEKQYSSRKVYLYRVKFKTYNERQFAELSEVFLLKYCSIITLTVNGGDLLE